MKQYHKNKVFSVIYSFIALAFLSITRAEERVISEEFKSKQFSTSSGWNSQNFKKCTAKTLEEYYDGNVFGIFAKETPKLMKTFTNLPPHWSLNVRMDVLLYSSVDNEKINVILDGQTLATYTKGNADGFDVCVVEKKYNDELFFFQKNITHTASTLNFLIQSAFDSDRDDEGYGIKNLSVRVDSCHPTCSACNGPSASQCTACPTNSKLNNGQCKCGGMQIAHEFECLNDCPFGYKADATRTVCIQDLCTTANCLKCDDKNGFCTECKDGFFLFNKSCVLTCPSFAPKVGKACQDPSLSTPQSKYALLGLTSNKFGESEIASLGIQLSGFDTATFNHCGGVQLLGGPYVGKKGAVIKVPLLKLKPHYQIRFGFQFYEIDSWDDEGFRIIADSKEIDLIKKNQANHSVNLCGSVDWKDEVSLYSKTISHTSESFNLEIQSTLDEVGYNESFGIRDFYIIVDYCPPGCSSCSPQCTACDDGFTLQGTKCVNFCAEDEFIQNKKCAKCDQSCKSCKDNATTCTSCNNSTYLMDSKCLSTCPENYFKNSQLNKCSECAKGDCPTCILPGYTSSCKNCNGFKVISKKC